MMFLTADALALIQLQIIDASGGSQGIRDNGQLQSAAAALTQKAYGEALYPTFFEKAAVLLRAIIADHPFVDGNKRTAMIATLVFMNISGHNTEALTDQQLEDFAVQVAVDHLDIATIAAWLKSMSKSKA